MNKHFITLSVWLNNAPHQAKMIAVIALLCALIALTMVPGAVAFAGPIDGGPDAVTPLSLLFRV